MKRIVIMGGSSGIGLRVAELLAASGWRVGVAGRKEEPMKKLKVMFPSQVEWAQIDVNHNDAPRRLLDLIGRLGGMDTYFHVSGVGYENPTIDMKEEIATVETNVVGFTRMVDTAYHFFKARGKGHLAIVSSVAGTKGIGDLASYSASKKFQQTYLQALEQLSHKNKVKIAFTDIRPGWIRTPLLDPEREYPMTMELQDAAKLIIKAIKKKTRIAVIDRKWAIAVFFWKLIPGGIWIKLPISVSSRATVEEEISNEEVELSEA